MNLALEARVSLDEKIVYPVSFLEDNLGYLLSVSTLVEEDVQCQIGYKRSRKCYAFDRYIVEGRIWCL